MADFTIRFQCKPLADGTGRPVRKIGVPTHVVLEGTNVSRLMDAESAVAHAQKVLARDLHDLDLLEILDSSGAVVRKVI